MLASLRHDEASSSQQRCAPAALLLVLVACAGVLKLVADARELGLGSLRSSLADFESEMTSRQLTSEQYCPEYLAVVRSYLNAYREPVLRSVEEEAHAYYRGRGHAHIIVRGGRLLAESGAKGEPRFCDACRNLETAQRLFGPLGDMDAFLCMDDAPQTWRADLPSPLGPPPWGYTTTPAHHEIPIPLLVLDVAGEPRLKARLQRLNASHPWEGRRRQAVWRGSTTGKADGRWGIDQDNWPRLPRVQLVNLSVQHPDLLDARLTACTQCSGRVGDVLKRMGFGYQPFKTVEDYFQYTMLVDVDGNTWSSRFPQLLSTGAAVFKQMTNYTDFFRPLLRPFEDYIPFREDLSDLIPLLHHYSHQQGGEEDLLRRIAQAGALAFHRLLTPSKQVCYMHLLASEYSLIQLAHTPRSGGEEEEGLVPWQSVCTVTNRVRWTVKGWWRRVRRRWQSDQ